jgi:hypothetical protein
MSSTKGILFYSVKEPKILPVTLYGCETWSLTVRKELKFKYQKNKTHSEEFLIVEIESG